MAALAYLLSRSNSTMPVDAKKKGESIPFYPPQDKHRIVLTAICFLSGFGVLALEVLWTRMFALVLENSVYTFAAILVVVLSCLAGGSLISSQLARRNWPPNSVLAVLLGLSGVTIALTPGVFMELTDSFKFQAQKLVWSDFVLLIFQKSLLTMGPPALVLGAVFPYLMKTEERC